MFDKFICIFIINLTYFVYHLINNLNFKMYGLEFKIYLKIFQKSKKRK